MKRALRSIGIVAIAILCLGNCLGTEVVQLTEENYLQYVPVGKEVDAIYGDWVLRNDRVTAIIANPVAGRNANMTVRGVGGMLIDFTTRRRGSDQLSCFYPAGGRYLFNDTRITCSEGDSEPELLEAGSYRKAVELRLAVVGQPISKDGTQATVTYTLRDGENSLDYSVQIRNGSDETKKLHVEDALRCDGNLFRSNVLKTHRLFYAEDVYFGQCYGVQFDSGHISKAGGRLMQLRREGEGEQEVASGESLGWSGAIACSQGLPGIRSWASRRDGGPENQVLVLKLSSPQGPIVHARVEVFRLDSEGRVSLGTMQSHTDGRLATELPAGNYLAKIQAFGQQVREHEFEIKQDRRSDSLSYPAASRVRAKITDGQGRPIAAKVQFVGRDPTESPNFGPDSAIYAVKNAVYCAKGQFEQPIDPGLYTAIISHGPEYDAEFREIEVLPGKLTQLTSTLRRVVQTPGWISSDFHSHSSPSGDNVSHQTGRVLNLLAEHVEFAPCTEHNRIDTYSDDLQFLDAEDAMATCTGMELTGSPLPINHQNAFPLHRHEHHQDGGGPVTHSDPVKQIERLALWDQSSPKVVQTNHPNIPQILGDRDLDGEPDQGFRGMLGWMDVIEIHPPESIFSPPAADISPKDKFENPMFFWLQLNNLGYRIPGVVNTDAHYNFHGSGWLRNYMQSSTDDPGSIEIEEMIHSAEHGHMVMTTGPFLDVEIQTTDGTRYVCGSDINLGHMDAKIRIRVQCPNWFDVNRVQVFFNGRPSEKMNFTRKTHPKLFRDSTTRFEWQAKLPQFTEDTHVIVATIGEGLTLGAVMGEQRGKTPPVAVTNPFFLDTDGSGFQVNGDDLGVPFMVPTPVLK